MEYSALYRQVGQTVQYTSERGSAWNMAGNLPTVLIFWLLVSLWKNDFVQNKFLKIITESIRARVCMCVHTYVHSSDYVIFTSGQQCFNITRTAIVVRNISVFWFVLRRDCTVQTGGWRKTLCFQYNQKLQYIKSIYLSFYISYMFWLMCSRHEADFRLHTSQRRDVPKANRTT